MHRTGSGFTIIELLIVMVIIGLLASIAIPKFVSSKERAFITAMKSDLRNLATFEESYQSDFFAYTTAPPDFVATTGVTGLSIVITADGWTAVVAHSATTKTCAIFTGSTSQAPATREGVPTCSS